MIYYSNGAVNILNDVLGVLSISKIRTARSITQKIEIVVITDSSSAKV